MPAQETLEFRSRSGEVVAVARLLAEDQGEPFVRLDLVDAAANGEEPLQLVEGRTYQYEVEPSGVTLEEVSGITKRFLVGTADLDRGTISTGLHTGMLRLHALAGGSRLGEAAVEVRSSKLTYREEYRAMLERIAEASVDLLVHLPAQSEQRLETDETVSSESLQQQFFFIRGLLEGEEFVGAIEQILRQPHSRLKAVDEERHLSRGIRGSAAVSRQLACGGRRQALKTDHPLHQKMSLLGITRPSLPWQITGGDFEETLDTNENRFVKHALESFREAIDQIQQRLRNRGGFADQLVKREVVPLQERLDLILSNDLFEEVSRATEIPISSPVLQRKAGYREILRTWLRFNATARLVWNGGEDVFGAGKRDIATLYEYWLFFVLWDVISPWLGELASDLLRNSLLEETSTGLGLKLKTGRYLPIAGNKIVHQQQELRLQFSYNRTFGVAPGEAIKKNLTYQSNHPKPGSWTRRMRPDFTLSIWPDTHSLADAEVEGLITHVHFDAKYSVEFAEQLFGSSDDDLESDKQLQRAGTYKRADLLKMHAYKDAIRRSQGAYVLYPGGSNQGAGNHSVWSEYHEVIPGLGAFVIKPTNEQAGKATLQSFISDILDRAADQSAHRKVESSTELP